MIRKLLLLATVALGCITSPAYGLGLGELELNSALNQQFSAEIELTNVRGLQVDEILPNLASQEDFDRVGVERNYLLTDLRFKVAANDSGNLVILVTSNKPIIEPFLNFIVEVLWPTGRILREYTVLLDPPVFGEGGVEEVRPSQASAPAPTPAPRATQRETRPTPRPPSRPTAAPQQTAIENNTDRRGQVSGDEYGMTGQGDTLWNIALRVRPNDTVSVQQTMLALQRANPEAFINNNINLLKAGYVLRIPDVREIREETVASAVQAVRTQNAQFDNYKEGGLAQLDATRRPAPTQSRDEQGGSGELKLLASDSTSGRAGSGDSARAVELENELAVAEEDLDRARRANAELNLKIDDIQGQLDTLNEILTLKDDQIAALRAELLRMQAEPAQPAPAPVQTSGSLLSNPLVLGGLGLLLVGAVVGLLFFLKQRQQAGTVEDEFQEFAEVEPEAEEALEAEAEAAPETEVEEEEDITPETSDVLGEVEIYIAYGRFPQAITFLQNAISAEPDRTDIQLKLLEVFVQTEDSVAFNLQLDQLRLLGDQEAIDKALVLQQKIPGAAEEAAVAMDATVISMEPVEAIAEPEDDDDDLSFDLDDLDSETEDDDLDLSADLDLDEDLDLSLEADDELENSADTVVLDEDEIELSLEGADDELDLDADLEIDLDGDEIELDLDLDESEEQTVDANSSTVELADDIELGLDDGDELEIDLDGDEISLDLDDDDEFKLDLDGDDELDLDLDLAEESEVPAVETAATADTTEIELDLGDDLEDELSLDDDVLDLSDLEDDEALDLEKELESVASELSTDDDDDELSLDLDADLEIDLDDDGLDLGDDEIALELEDESEISLDLDDEDELAIDLGDDDELSIDLGDDELDLDLDDDGLLDLSDEDDNKLDLARAYVDMGDTEGAKSLLQEIAASGSIEEKQEAADMLEKLES